MMMMMIMTMMKQRSMHECSFQPFQASCGFLLFHDELWVDPSYWFKY